MADGCFGIGFPHPLQNEAISGFISLHLGHMILAPAGCEAEDPLRSNPHCLQNLASDLLFKLHLGHIMETPSLVIVVIS